MKYSAVCCTVKNEQNIIREWMAFHKAVGFDQLIIVDHMSTDKTADIVAAFPDQASVSMYRWDRPGTQMDMYNFILEQHANDFTWGAFIDADEFLYPALSTVGSLNINAVLQKFEAYDAIGVNWIIYGSSGYKTRPDGLVIENFVHRSENDFVINRHIKSIVKMNVGAKAVTSHYFQTPHGTVDDMERAFTGVEQNGYYENRPADRLWLRLNHYHTRSWEDYEAKAKRGFFGSDDAKLAELERRKLMFELHDRNDVVDRSACRYLGAMKPYLADSRT